MTKTTINEVRDGAKRGQDEPVGGLGFVRYRARVVNAWEKSVSAPYLLYHKCLKTWVTNPGTDRRINVGFRFLKQGATDQLTQQLATRKSHC